jgi:hypothetical protein
VPKRKNAVEYQPVKEGKTRDHIRNVRFDDETYNAIRALAKKHNWSFARVVGEAVEWYLGLTPLLQTTEEKSKLLAGKPLVIGYVKEYLEQIDAQLDEAILEYTTVSIEE